MPVLSRQDPQRKERLRAELQRILPILIEMGARQVILFGSMARDTAGRASDLDLIVVCDTSEPFAARLDTFYTALQPRMAVDLLIYTPQEWEHMQVNSPLVRHAMSKGKVVYET